MKKKLFTSTKVLKSSLLPLVFILGIAPVFDQCNMYDDDYDDDEYYDDMVARQSVTLLLENSDGKTFYM